MGLYDDEPGDALAASPDGPPPGWERCRLESRGWGFRFDHPSDWRRREDSDEGFARASPAAGGAESVTAEMKALDYLPTIEQHAAGALERLRDQIPGVNVLARRARLVGGTDGFQVEFASAGPEGRRRGLQLFGLRGNVAFTLTVLGPDPASAAFAPVLERIVASFEAFGEK